MNIDKILEELTELATNPVHNSGNVNGIFLNIDNFKYSWSIKNEINSSSDYQTKVNSIDDAIEIIHQFSKDPKNEITNGIQKDIKKLEDGKDIYLNVSKIPPLI